MGIRIRVIVAVEATGDQLVLAWRLAEPLEHHLYQKWRGAKIWTVYLLPSIFGKFLPFFKQIPKTWTSLQTSRETSHHWAWNTSRASPTEPPAPSLRFWPGFTAMSASDWLRQQRDFSETNSEIIRCANKWPHCWCCCETEPLAATGRWHRADSFLCTGAGA